MNKTISINIAGFVFNIEEQAYAKLNLYLDSIKKNFNNEADCDDIMDDIESRIAELFHEKISPNKEVIIESDVEDIIIIMGKPEDYISEEQTSEQSAPNSDNVNFTMGSQEGSFQQSASKRLYRDEQGGSLAGICSGLGYFFGLDPVLIRIGFVILTILGGSGILLYIILWVVIPEAKTTAEILEMKGQNVNLGSIKDHVQEFKGAIKDNSKYAKNNFKKAVHTSVRASSKFAQSLSKIFGMAFTLGGIFALFVMFIILFGDSGLLPFVGTEQVENLPTLLGVLYPGESAGTFVLFAIIVVALIPIISMIFVGIKLLFGIQGKNKRTAIIVSIIWLLGAGSLILTGIDLGMNFREHVEIDYEVPLDMDSTNVLIVDVKRDNIFSNHIEYNQIWNYTELVKVKEDKIFLGYPELRITQKEDSTDFEVLLYKKSNGLTNKDAINKAEKINYNIDVQKNKLSLAPYFIIDKEDKLRNQQTIIEIKIPLGKKIKFGKNIDRIMVDVRDEYFRQNESFANTTWYIDSDGFRCIECKESRRIYYD
jgi:phage shock protein PspC (stress-responsive transcriptional regulator)